LLVDDNPEALEVMARRFAGVAGIEWQDFDPSSVRAKDHPAGMEQGDAIGRLHLL